MTRTENFNVVPVVVIGAIRGELCVRVNYFRNEIAYSALGIETTNYGDDSISITGDELNYSFLFFFVFFLFVLS